ncbi:hypothetical protein GGC47_003957 [Bosea sp. OAE752]|uniref:hypothetical protein n=1 Tax=Bosea sp. OAE752 TaxID=2663873 RepID=UPI003D1D5CCB
MTHALIGTTALRRTCAHQSVPASAGDGRHIQKPIPEVEIEDAGELYDIEEVVLFIDSADHATRSRKFALYLAIES